MANVCGHVTLKWVTWPPTSENHPKHVFSICSYTIKAATGQVGPYVYISRRTGTARGRCLQTFTTTLAHLELGHVTTHVRQLPPSPKNTYFSKWLLTLVSRRPWPRMPRYIGCWTSMAREPRLQIFTTTPAHLKWGHVTTHVWKPSGTRLFQHYHCITQSQGGHPTCHSEKSTTAM